MSNSSRWPIPRTLASTTILDQSGIGYDGNERIFHISQSSSITRASPSDCFVSYPEHLFRGGGLTPLQRCSQCILSPRPTNWASVINCFDVCTIHVFGYFHSIMTQFRLIKASVPELDYVTHSSVQLSNYIWSKTMHNESAHLLPWYNQSQRGIYHELNCFSHVTYAPQKRHVLPKYYKTFDSPEYADTNLNIWSYHIQ